MESWPETDYRIFCGDLGNEVTDDVNNLKIIFRFWLQDSENINHFTKRKS